ncbi:hypothetical protein LOSG293_040550 [Secundilactobacillus oryzae JCM 18671]|uniref:Uncharacterized protein n=1 Tax=Secundilactobacillus oryzae JCM 18671 TaxID=1291743 RepID=A0A081BGZ1_9LACO|nr:hypothetical protein [Secundilactobacillus oryzae]GAK47309.1 hypothetical protein LOSG293_040550 [Secundilactobacillus oryzae JCM 18671]
MLIEGAFNQNSTIIPVQLIMVTPQRLMAVTETNQMIEVNVANKACDKTFWESLQDIARNKIWIPITKAGHYLIDTDWIADDEGQPTDIEAIDDRQTGWTLA